MKTNKTVFSTDAASQCSRILGWLREKPITTLEARKDLDILMPAARIFELRHDKGLNIQLHWAYEMTDMGVSHRVGKYALHPGKWMGGQT